MHKVSEVQQPLVVRLVPHEGASLTNHNWECSAVPIGAVPTGLQIAKCNIALLPQGVAKEGSLGDSRWVHMRTENHLHIQHRSKVYLRSSNTRVQNAYFVATEL